MLQLLFINRSYYPCGEATGQLLTQLCESLTETCCVKVVAGRPNRRRLQQDTPLRVARSEERNGVTIRRVWQTGLSKRSRVGRLTNLATFTIGAARAARQTAPFDMVIAETDPPFLCLVARRIAKRYGVPYIAYLQDLHPEIGLAIGHLRKHPHIAWLQRRFLSCYREADHVIVPGDDMKDYLISRGVAPDRMSVVPNWVDTADIRPWKADNPFRRQHGLCNRFVVMYSGNLGLCQQLETVLDAAQRLRHEPHVVFMLVGDGAKKIEYERLAARRGLANVRFLPPQPVERLAASLSAADVHLVPVDPRVHRYLMPSKLYGALASGTPVLSIAPPGSSLARLVKAAEVGANVPPANPHALAHTINAWRQQPRRLRACGENARRLAVEQFDRRVAVASFAAIVHRIGKTTTAGRPATPSYARVGT